MFYDIFEKLCYVHNVKPNTVTKAIGLSTATATNWKTSMRIPSGETLVKLADYFHCSVDYLLGRAEGPSADSSSKLLYSAVCQQQTAENADNVVIQHFAASPANEKNTPSLSDEALHIARRYAGLDPIGAGAVRAIIDYAEGCIRPEGDADKERENRKTKIIPLLGNSFAAGPAEPDFGNMWEDYEVEADNPAQFAIRINGDSMEPYLPDGAVVYGKKEAPRDGDVGAFWLDGEFLCKQICQDNFGNIYLFSLNRERADADVTIWHDSGRTLNCFGTIIMEKRIPLPKT